MKNEPKILDKNWPWQFLAAFLFVGVMAFIWYMVKGFNEDFGMGFAIGGMTGGLIVLLGAGWRRGEMTREEVLPPHERCH